MLRLTRRRWLTLSALCTARSAWASDDVLTTREVTVASSGRFGRQCLLVRPRRVPEHTPLPHVVLFHGLAETQTEPLGIHAWYDRYGLPQAYARLVAPPVLRTLPKQRYLSDSRLEAINADLARAPFADVALICPFTPNVLKPGTAPLLDQYAQYVEHALLPAIRATSAMSPEPGRLGVDGVSLGGYVALEVFMRTPQLFGAVGSLQGAFGLTVADTDARRLAEIVSKWGARHIHVATSSFDPFRDAAQRLAQRLAERAVPATFTLAEGPHDQRFLREAGTLELLLFQSRALTVA